ncbi:MAG: pyridoxamine 5'-phosphate oxidase [Verrucomicrobiia bacterium]|tara:strand:+ start:9044 stop:9682 length:639 start_codon:yes stop_codon:yes gene_type:complete
MTKLTELRKEYTQAGLNEAELSANPFEQFNHWFEEAKAAGILEPNAMTLATVREDGTPAARTVLLKEADERGFVFFTNYQSAKAADLAAQPRATLVFPWLGLERQVIISGEVTKVSREETEAYFKIRPSGSQLGAWASQQSTTVTDRATLEAKLEAVTERFAKEPISAPPHWGGYRVAPTQIEFWQGRPNRLHDRLVFRRESDAWVVERLAP